jgi:hypothetical protein
MEAVFDGRVLLPQGVLPIKPNTRVRITIEPIQPEDDKPVSFLDVARSLAVDGPRDWSSNLEEYLYGGRDLDGA